MLKKNMKKYVVGEDFNTESGCGIHRLAEILWGWLYMFMVDRIDTDSYLWFFINRTMYMVDNIHYDLDSALA